MIAEKIHKQVNEKQKVPMRNETPTLLIDNEIQMIPKSSIEIKNRIFRGS